MKVLYLTDEFPPKAFGGAAMVVYDTAKAVAERGHKVFVITTSGKKTIEKREEDRVKIFTLHSKYYPFFRHYISVYNPFLLKKIKKIIKEIKPDIIHAHNIHAHLSYGTLKIAKKSGAKVFLTAHDTMLVTYDKVVFKEGNENYKISFYDNFKKAGKRYNPFRNLAIKHYLRYVDKVFAISNVLKRMLNQNGIETEVLYNGINTALWGEPEQSVSQSFRQKFGLAGKKIIFFGGRLSGAKGALKLIEAFVYVLKRAEDNKDIVLLVAGKEPPDSDKIKKAIEINGLCDKVIFTKWLSREEMKIAFFASDICVTPSLYFDSFNLFNIEAMAASKPVVGTIFGGTPEIVVDKETGFIVDPNDSEFTALKITRLLEDSKLAETMGQKGRERVEDKFSLSKHVDKLLNFYKG